MKILYILVRNDMESMNPGKAIAQGSHATSRFHRRMEVDAAGTEQFAAYNEWCAESSSGDFGTVLTLAVSSGEQLVNAVTFAKQFGLVAGVAHDDTYPLRDGEMTHYIPVDTAGYIFGEKDDCWPVVGGFELYP